MTLEDIGTRFKHYSELLDLWDSGLEILNERKRRESYVNEEQYREIKSAVSLLRKQIDILSGYDPWLVRGLINNIPNNTEVDVQNQKNT